MIVAGGGVIYSEATDALRRFVDATGIAVGETQAGKGALPDPHPLSLGGVGATGTRAANRLARDADLVIVIGSRLSDFTTASKTAFQHERRALHHDQRRRARRRQARARCRWSATRAPRSTSCCRCSPATASAREYDGRGRRSRRRSGRRKSSASVPPACPPKPPSRAAVAIDAGAGHRRAPGRRSRPTDVIVCAAGSLPGDLHKLWRARDPKGYHLEYGYSCMGYEIAGGLGVKMAAPDREVYVLVGDGSYLMMAQEIVTAVQERHQDDDRAARQSRLRQHRRPVGVGRQRRLRHALPLPQPGDRRARRRRCCRSTSPPTPRRSARDVWRADTLAALRDALAAARTASHDRRSSSSRSTARRASAATSRGGTCRSPRCRRRREVQARASGVRRSRGSRERDFL